MNQFICVLLIAFSFSLQILSQSTTITGTPETVVHDLQAGLYVSGGPYEIGRYQPNQSTVYIARSIFTFPISIPPGSIITNVNLNYSTSNTGFKFKITDIPNKNFQTGQAFFDAVGSASTLFDQKDYSTSTISLNSTTFTTLVNSKIGQNLYLGAMCLSENVLNSHTDLYMQITIDYTTSVVINLDNNFTASDLSHGIMMVDGMEVPMPSNPSRQTQTTLNLSAISPQMNSQNVQMIWHSGQNNLSEWLKDGVRYSTSPTISYTVLNNTSFAAVYKQNFRIDQVQKKEFDGTTNGPTSWIVEQNSGTITASNIQDYNFAGWEHNFSLGSAFNLSPTSNMTFNALYKKTNKTNNGFTLQENNQRKVIKSNSGNLHMVYQSMGYIWYEKSTDNGNTWIIQNNGKPVNDQWGAVSPSLDYFDSGGTENEGEMTITDYILITYYREPYIYVKYFVNGIYDEYSNEIVNETPIYSSTTPVIACKSAGRFVIAYNMDGAIFYSFAQSVGSDHINYWYERESWVEEISGVAASPTIACLKFTQYPNRNIFHLAWCDDYSNIEYITLVLDQSWQSLTRTDYSIISIGSGYPSNYHPVLMVNFWDNPSIAWTASPYYGSTSTRTLVVNGTYRSGSMTWGTFSQLGSENFRPSLQFSNSGNILAWSKYSGNAQVYKWGGIYNIPSVSNFIQLSNSNDVIGMYSLSLENQSLPYDFLTSNVYNLNKENSFAMNNGRGSVLINKKAQFYYYLGDVSFNSIPIDFVEINDSTIDNLEELNAQFLTNTFSISESGNLQFSTGMNFLDSLSVVSFLNNGNSINYKVELINAATQELLGCLLNIIIDQSTVIQEENNTYSLTINNISNEVQIRVVINTNSNFKPNLITILNDSNVLPKMAIKEMNWNEVAVTDFYLSDNYPNPFNPSTTIKYQIPRPTKITLKVYDILGNEVITLVDGIKEPGRYEVTFNAENLSSGVYIYQLSTEQFVSSKKMLLIK